MTAFPIGHEALVEAGYTFLDEGVCKTADCGGKILWYRAPSGQIMPIDVITHTPHWLSCPGASKHRKKKEKPMPPPDPQGGLFRLREPGED